MPSNPGIINISAYKTAISDLILEILKKKHNLQAAKSIFEFIICHEDQNGEKLFWASRECFLYVLVST